MRACPRVPARSLAHLPAKNYCDTPISQCAPKIAATITRPHMTAFTRSAHIESLETSRGSCAEASTLQRSRKTERCMGYAAAINTPTRTHEEIQTNRDISADHTSQFNPGDVRNTSRRSDRSSVSVPRPMCRGGVRLSRSVIL